MSQECRDDSENLAAGLGHRERHFAHQADAAAAEHEIESGFDQQRAESPRRLGVDGIGPVGRTAKDANCGPQA